MNTKVKKILIILYIVLMAIAFTTRCGDIFISNNVQYIIAIIIIGISFFSFIINGKNRENAKDLKKVFKWYFIPPLLIHLYTLILMMVGIFDKAYFSTNISKYIPILLAISSIYIFEEKAFDYNFIALILSWFLSFFISIICKGINVIPYAIMQAYFEVENPIGEVSKNYLELHDLVLTLGCIFVYFIYNINMKKRINKKEIYSILIALVILGLGMKRITILGILVSFIFIKCMKHISKENKIKLCKIAGGTILIACYIYVYIILNSEILYDFCDKYNINLMGRNYYYDVIAKYGDFSIGFLGTGRNSVTKILTKQYNYLHVGGVHSDILKSYIENGFIVFGLWLWYYLIDLTKKYEKQFGTSSAILYFCLTIYTFILYFTDNVENYFIYQIFYTIIPITYAIKHQKMKKEKMEE